MTATGAAMRGPEQLSARDLMFEQLVLRDVRLLKWSGEMFGEARIGEIRVPPASAGYFTEDRRVACRFDQSVALLNPGGDVIAVISVAILVDFHFEDEGAPSLDLSNEDHIRRDLIPGAWSVGYPYVREAVQTMSTRLGLGTVSLGVIVTPEDVTPQDVHVRGVAEFRAPAR